MATYTVKPNQNLFDVALHLYGSIEGLFDILISNPEINMSTELQYGQEIQYHPQFIINQSIVDEMKEQQIIPSSGSRQVYFKRPTEDLLMIFGVNAATQYCSFIASGAGVMQIDWGDNSTIETVNLTYTDSRIEHYFDNDVKQRRIKIYGDSDYLQFTHIDTTGIGGAVVVCRPVTVDKYTCVGMEHALTGLSMFEGIYDVNLRESVIASLLPIGGLQLQDLDLTDVYFTQDNVLDDYLEYVVAHHADRRPCTIRMTVEPGPRGYAAIDTILNEPEWNISDTWKFYINNELYIPENGTNPQ